MTTPRPVVEAENRLERFNADRDRIVAEVERRILGDCYPGAATGGDGGGLEYVLNDVAYHEIHRLEAAGGKADHLAEWRSLAMKLGRMSEEDKRERLGRPVRHHDPDTGWT